MKILINYKYIQCTSVKFNYMYATRTIPQGIWRSNTTNFEFVVIFLEIKCLHYCVAITRKKTQKTKIKVNRCAIV